jgi:hypothetical protein
VQESTVGMLFCYENGGGIASLVLERLRFALADFENLSCRFEPLVSGRRAFAGWRRRGSS